MSAPAHEKPATEQPTQPLPISETLPPGGSWLMSEASGILIPATVLAAIAAGTLLRDLVFVTEEQQSSFAITALAAVYILTWLALVIPKILDDRPHRGTVLTKVGG